MTCTISKKATHPVHLLVLFLCMSQLLQCVNYSTGETSVTAEEKDDVITGHARKMLMEGKENFRYQTFGNELYWSNVLKLHKVFTGEKNGGTGPGLSLNAAMEAGLKLDIELIPANISMDLKTGKLDQDNPNTLLTLLQLNAVLGVNAIFDRKRDLVSIGFTCASCHSTVDNSFAPGIGRRLDGWANRDLDLGKLIAMSPEIKVLSRASAMDTSAIRSLLRQWGPGKYNTRLGSDPMALGAGGKPDVVLIPSIFNTGIEIPKPSGTWKTITWRHSDEVTVNQGLYFDPHQNAANENILFPTNIKESERDLMLFRLSSLAFYRMAIPAPAAPATSYNRQAAELGKALFKGKANCVSCHSQPSFTDNKSHTGPALGIAHLPGKSYETPSLLGLWTRNKGGYYSDGRFPALKDVIAHYNHAKQLALSDYEKRYLLEYLKSL